MVHTQYALGVIYDAFGGEWMTPSAPFAGSPAPAGLATLDAAGRISAVGRRLSAITGLPVADLLDRLFAELLEPGSRPELDQALTACRCGHVSSLRVRLLTTTGISCLDVICEPLASAATGWLCLVSITAVLPDQPPPPATDEARRASLYADEEAGRVVPLADLVAQLGPALTARQFVLHYQPLVSLDDYRITGVEALLRWDRPDCAFVGPDGFLAAARAAGLMDELNAFVLHTACADATRWPGWRVAVNVSPRQLTSPRLLPTIDSALAAAQLEPGRLTVEITEESFSDDMPAALMTLQQLADHGVRLSLDDFGTGYSSLLNLRDFPIHELKIDRAFIGQLGVHPNNELIVRSVLSLGSALGLDVLAEGIETPDQLQLLQRLGCPNGQGYLLGRPAPAPVLDDLHHRRSVMTTDLPQPAVAPVGQAPGGGAEAKDAVTARMWALQQAGASLHTIAAALNVKGLTTIDGRRWTATSVARHMHPVAAEPDEGDAGQLPCSR